ncbi:MAG TPA: sigma 54-interacting transcriptional regulator [Nitrospiria bacterium]|nr:sigma 54-interacting transcriptional regulator [Nitrospiria bacterium]
MKIRSQEEIILNCISDGVITIGLDRKIRYINQAMRLMLGLEDDLDTRDLSCKDLVQSDICNTEECIFHKALLTKERLSNYETVIRNREGIYMPVSINTDFLKDNNGDVVGIVEVFRNLSLVKGLEGNIKELENRIADRGRFGNIIGNSKAIREILAVLPTVANSKSTVLLEGESGTGKELIANAIHLNSPRRDKSFVAVNCAALAEGILESELFGHVKGAFTGAYYDKLGRFELADKGTIFLDEIGDVSLSTQGKLLRVLQEEELERVGGTKSIRIDIRVIAASNKDLLSLVKRGEFRDDLYYRIRVFPIRIPPLRERKEDVPQLVRHFISIYNKEVGKDIKTISHSAMAILLSYDYPGNVRELENIIEHASVCCHGDTIQVEHLPNDIIGNRDIVDKASKSTGSLKIMERELMLKVLDQSGWNYKEAAKILGLSRTTLWRRLKEFNIKREKRFKMQHYNS